jgi:phosphoglycerol transferase MdoB-like AlkP superfamily enzyme
MMLAEMKLIDPPGTETVPQEAVFDKIIIIAVESLDYDYIGATNPAMPSGITPNLDRFSSEFISLTNYYTASQPTSWGLTSLLLSRVDYDRDRYITPPSLFTLAKEQGYYTCYFSAASGHFGDNRRIYSYLFRADKSIFREDWQRKYQIKASSNWGISDNDLYKCVLQELEAGKKQKFIAVISPVDTHPPYANHGELSESVQSRFPTPFLQSLHNTDREIGRFVRALMEDPDFYDDRTLIIITADHTATFGENYLQRADFTPGRIPLILICKNPEVFADLKTDKFASSIDLPPTLLRLIGAVPPESFMGRDLFSDKNCAITRLFNDALYIYSPEGLWAVPTAECDESDPRQKAVCDFFYSFYGLPQ